MENFVREYPEQIANSVDMNSTNQTIHIYDGTFKLVKDDMTIDVNGKIWFDWTPRIGAKFSGSVDNVNFALNQFDREEGEIKLFIDDLEFGNCYISRTHYSETTEIEGGMSGVSIKGDRSIPVKKIKFSIPNLREFFGDITEIKNENSILASRNRLVFDNENLTITIDKKPEYSQLSDLLESEGGYILLYSGELVSKKGGLTATESREIFECFYNFITFLNGRSCSPVFIQGVHEDEVVWYDYTGYLTDSYKSVWYSDNSCGSLPYSPRQ
jgi:hypothetical protein